MSLKAFLALPFKPLVFLISWLVPRNKDLWTFMAGDGDRFADNSKYMFLYCNDKADIRNIWIGTNGDVVSYLRGEGYEAYSTETLRGKYMMLRSGVFFETHGPIAPEYTGRAKIIHLTHGNYLKTMLDDHARDWPRLVKLTVELLFERRRRYVITSDGPPLENMKSMRGAPDTRMLMTGFPRNDALFEELPGEQLGLNHEALTRVAEMATDRTILLYAPTHREGYDERNGLPLSELNFGLDRINRVLSEANGHLYISPHPKSMFDVDVSGLDHIEMLDTGGDIYPFLRHCDALLTDYSGIFYDFLLLDRPLLFYAPDLKEYHHDRGFYFEYEDHVPGPVATEPDELAVAIKNILTGTDQYIRKRQAIRAEFYANPDGKSRERVYRRVRDQVMGS